MTIQSIHKPNLNVSDLNLLIVFEALYREQSVTRAGERIGLAQPSVSSALNRLRALMNDQLFVRTSNKMVPTARAEQLIEPVTQALYHASRALARDVPFDINNPGERSFKIAVSDYSGLVVLPKLIGALRSRSPKLKFNIEQLDRAKLERQFHNREVDIAIGGHLTDNKSTRTMPLFRDRFVCIRAKTAEPKSPLTMESYLAAEHVMFRSHGADSVPCVIDQLLELQSLKRNVVSFIPHISSVPFIVAEAQVIATISYRVACVFADKLPIEICEVPMNNLEDFDVLFQCSTEIEHDKSLQWIGDLAKSVFGALSDTTMLQKG